MTEQEAMQNAYGTSGWRNSESVFNSGWKAALEWAQPEVSELSRLRDSEVFYALGRIPLQSHVTDDFLLAVANAIMDAMIVKWEGK